MLPAYVYPLSRQLVYMLQFKLVDTITITHIIQNMVTFLKSRYFIQMLEIRTRDSKREMEMMESLEELRELNQRHVAINYEEMLQKRQETEEEKIAREKKEEDEEIRCVLISAVIWNFNGNLYIKILLNLTS